MESVAVWEERVDGNDCGSPGVAQIETEVATHARCWTHMRRYFKRVLASDPQVAEAYDPDAWLKHLMTQRPAQRHAVTLPTAA